MLAGTQVLRQISLAEGEVDVPIGASFRSPWVLQGPPAQPSRFVDVLTPCSASQRRRIGPPPKATSSQTRPVLVIE